MKKIWICLIVIVLGFGFLSQCKKSEATKPQFTLTVVLTEGVEGTPANGVQSHQEGQTIVRQILKNEIRILISLITSL